MPAEVEKQRVAIMGDSSWEEFRAVCRDHPEEDIAIPGWMAKDTHQHWIHAALDAIVHNADAHPRRARRVKAWESILFGPDTPEDSLLPRGRLHPARHAVGAR